MKDDTSNVAAITGTTEEELKDRLNKLSHRYVKVLDIRPARPGQRFWLAYVQLKEI